MAGLILVILAILQVPFIQNKLFERFLQHLSQKTQFTIEHQNFRCPWFKKLVLTGLQAKDKQDQLFFAIQDLEVQINPLKLLINPRLTIESIQLTGAHIQLVKHPTETLFNSSLFLANLTGNEQPDKTTLIPWLLKKVSLKDVAILVDDQTVPKLAEGFDPNHLAVEQIAVDLANLRIDRDALSVQINNIAGSYADQHLQLNKFYTHCKVTSSGLQLADLHVQTDHSHLKGHIEFSYEDISSLAHFVDQVHLVAQLEEFQIDAGELGNWLPYFKAYQTAYTLSGKLVGKVSDLSIEDFHLEFGEQKSHLQGYMSCQGLPHFQETFFHINLEKSCFYLADLYPYIEAQHHKTLAPIKVCAIQGNFLGTPTDFISQAHFDTDIGKLKADIEVNMDSTFQAISYQGTISTEQLEMGLLLGTDQVQGLTMQAQIAGQGPSLATAAHQVKADIDQLVLHHYPYQGIHTEGRFEQAFFEGSLSVADPHLSLQANATIDWREPAKKIDLQAKIDQACLDTLGLMDEKSHLSTDIAVSLQGSSLDDLNLDATFSDTHFDLAQKPLYLKELHILNTHQTGYNKFEALSDFFAVQAEGRGTYTALAQDIQQFIQAYQQRLLVRKRLTPQYTKQPYQFTYLINLKEINPLLQVFKPALYIAPNTILSGTFAQGDSVALTLHLPQVTSLAFQDYRWEQASLSLTAHQLKDGTMLSASSKLTAEKQQWGGDYVTNQLVLEADWNNDQITFKHHLGHPSQAHQLDLQGKALLSKDQIELTFQQADIQIENRLWQLHPDNWIQLKKSQIKGHHIRFTHQDQAVSLEGSWSTNLNEGLQLKLHEFSLDNFNALLLQKVSGIANGTILLQANANQLLASSYLKVRDIHIRDILIGDLQVKTDWDHLRRLNVACHLTHLERPTAYIVGSYNPRTPKQSLDLEAHFTKTQLAILEPFMGNLFSELSGELEGRLHIQGPLLAPQILGQAQVKQGTIKINYLNVLYRCEGLIHFDDKSIYTQALHLADDQQGKAVLRGSVNHTRLQDWKLALSADMTNFKGLETTWENNNDFYGTAMVTGRVTLSGPVDKIAIGIKATTQKGTNLTIPTQKYGKQVGQEDYIKFVNLKAPKEEVMPQEHVTKLKGLSLSMELEITPDAWASIILNPGNGDTIQSRGKGNLGIKIDEEGTLSMTGHYQLVEGKYTFSLYNMIKKKFKILEGSTITWYNKPYEGILNVQAAYDQRVSLNPILPANISKDPNKDSNQPSNKYPVSVILDLQGILSRPDIHFKFEFKELPDQPDLQAAINAFRAKTAADQQYTMNQVFSLVILKRFFSENLVATSNGTLGRSVGEIFSQQLGNFASQLDENLELDTDVDLEDLNKGARLRVGYNLLSGRLRISREGSINLNNEHPSGVADLVGDLTVEYVLTKDRRWRAKVYSKRIRTSLIESSTLVAGGVSLVYVKSFNWWKELFRSNRSYAIPKSREESNPGE